MSATRTDITGRVTRLIRALLPADRAGQPLDEESGLLGHGIGIDSVEALQLVAAAEREFGLTVADDELLPQHFETVGAFVSFVAARLPQRAERAEGA